MWRVDTTDRRPLLAEFGDACGHAATHSAIARPTAAGRLAAFADYLEFDFSWLSRRCAQLARQGCGELVKPRSRLRAVAGVEAACASVAGVSAGAP
jgi:hypothetical protein